MLDALKSLFENNVVSEEIRADIETAWNSKIQENRELVTQQLREEFAQKYEHDKDAMVEAVEASSPIAIKPMTEEELSTILDAMNCLPEVTTKFFTSVSYTSLLASSNFLMTSLPVSFTLECNIYYSLKILCFC